MSKTKKKVQRVQAGVQIEKPTLQVLQAIAAKHDHGPGDLIEGIVLHSLEGKPPLAGEKIWFTLVLQKISSPGAYRAVYKVLHGVFTGLSLHSK